MRRNWVDVAMITIGAIVMVFVFAVVVPRIANYGDVWRAVRGVSWIWFAALAVAAALNVLTFGPPYMAALPGLRPRPALTSSLAATASTFIAPGGPAVGIGLAIAMLKAWGFPLRVVTVAVTLTALWNLFMTFGVLPSLALALLTLSGGASARLQGITAVGLVIFGSVIGGFAIVLSNATQARILGNLTASVASRLLRAVRREPVQWSGESWVEFRANTLDLLRRRWPWLTLATLLNHLTVYLVLLVTLRALGISTSDVTLAESFAAWTISRAIGAIPITPGGFGLVEVGLTGTLVAFGGSTSTVVAAVLVYRFMTVAPPLVLGVIAGATWKQHHPGWGSEPSAAPGSR